MKTKKQETPEHYAEICGVDLAALKTYLETDLDLPLLEACKAFGVKRHGGAIAELAGVDTTSRYKRYRAWKSIRPPFDKFGEAFVRETFDNLDLNTSQICSILEISHTHYIKICDFLGFTAADRKAKRRESQGLDPIIKVKNEFHLQTLSGDGKSLELLSRPWK